MMKLSRTIMEALNHSGRVLNPVRVTLFILAVTLGLSSCDRGEIPIKPHDPGNVTTSSVEMSNEYKWQIFFDLGTNSVVGENLKTIWDLGFETSPEGFHIVLNTAKLMYAYNTGLTDFSAVTDTIGLTENHTWDETSGNLDSTAIGDWRNTGEVYIIDRGYNELGQHRGYRKAVFQEVDEISYTIRTAKLDGDQDTTITLVKDNDYNFTFFTFNDGGGVVSVEPPKGTWDLAFTQYTHIFYDETPVTPYLVTGCLHNRYNTKAIMDNTIGFKDIDYDYALSKMLTANINAIGYDWKFYDFDLGSYTVFAEMNYIIQDSEGVYYKLHFIDFYDHQGQKGSPKFEFQRL